MTPSAAVADFGGQRYRRFIPFNFLLSLAAPHIHGILVLVTDNKFIGGGVITNDNCSPASSPAINLSPVTTTPVIKFTAGDNDTGDKLFAGVIDTAEQFMAPAINIHSRLSLRIFEKIQNGANGILGGLGDTDS